MAVPATMIPTPQATNTIAMGENTGAGSEFYQRVTGNLFMVYSNVPNALAQNILQSSDPDTIIPQQLSAYPRRIVAV